MDSLISLALEEICTQDDGTGVSLSCLWSKLNGLTTLSPSIKASLYSNLLRIPSLRFLSRNGAFRAEDTSIQRLEDAEALDMRIVACSNLRDNFVGIYGTSLSTEGNLTIQKQQRRTLERLATARSNGITQSQLAKELGVKAKEFFYVVRNLECKGLIVRQPAVVWTKEPSSKGESKKSSCVNTNLMYLYRYAKHLGSQQRYEVCKEATVRGCGSADENAATEDGYPGKSFREDVHINNFIPSMRAICDKLEEASGRVVVVSDIRRDLGYCGSPSRRKTWKYVCQRLINAGIVEEFDGKVHNKVERCLCLLKKFSSITFEQNSCRLSDTLEKEQVKFGRSRDTEQLFELPIQHQIYDMIDARGSEGLTLMELSDRLGIDEKKCNSRVSRMLSKFGNGMHLQIENHKKTMAYRIWTYGNSNCKSSNAFLNQSKSTHGQNDTLFLDNCISHNVPHGQAQTFLQHNHSTWQGEMALPASKNDREVDTKIVHDSFGDGKINYMVPCHGNPQDLVLEPGGKPVDSVFNFESKAMETVSSETKRLALPKSFPYPSVSLTPDGLLRAQRILQRLQDDRFILISELPKWLMSLETDKSRAIDRKSIERILAKLQQEGHCQCFHFNAPYVTDFVRNREHLVVLHSSVDLTSNILDEFYDRMRSFSMQTHGHSAFRPKKGKPVPVFDDVKRIQSRDCDTKTVRKEAKPTTAYVTAKMVRAKLLHNFLWEYLSSSSGWKDALSSDKAMLATKNPHSSCYLFSLESAIKDLPLEMFLQVVGSPQKFDDMIERCGRGLHLSDLPFEEYKQLMDTRATAKLSFLVDILQRLKLIRLASSEHSDTGFNSSDASLLKHAMELKPYIEEPLSAVTTSNIKTPDLCQRIRHDFVLKNREAVDKYWRTLEYCYAAADPKAASTFPGCAVNEVFHQRSWTSVPMKAPQAKELLKRVVNAHGKLSYKECENIAKDLNLSLDQVQIMYSDRQQASESQDIPNADGEKSQSLETECSSSPKRKRTSEGRSVKRMRVDALTRQLDGQRVATSPDTADKEYDFHLLEYQDADHPEGVEDAPPEGKKKCHEDSFSKKWQLHAKRCSWTEEMDRQLVIQYVRQRAALGLKFHSARWASLPNLPAPPKSCTKRLSTLILNSKVREAIMKLCNLLSERCVKHLEQGGSMSPNNIDDRQLLQSSSNENRKKIISGRADRVGDLKGKRWDDFDDEPIKKALENVLQLKRMRGGSCSPYVLGDSFKDIFRSPFPDGVGKRAAEFSAWLYEREADLIGRGIDLVADLQCGDIFHLFALVSSGEFSISPRLPEEGVGEAEDLRGMKRKSEENELCERDKVKKSKISTDLNFRRDKGFPGIKVSICRTAILPSNAVEMYKDGDINTNGLHRNAEPSCHSDYVRDIHNCSKYFSTNSMAGLYQEMEVDDGHKITILNHPETGAGLLNEIQTSDNHEVCAQSNAVMPGLKNEVESNRGSPAGLRIPILPLINGDRTVSTAVYKKLSCRVVGMVMQNPGMLEDAIIGCMDELNPQSCKKLLELMVLDKHLIVRKMHETTYHGPPPILGSLLDNNFRNDSRNNAKMVYRDHLFANPKSTYLL